MAVLNKSMDADAELVRNPVSKHQIQPEYRDTKFLGVNADRELLIFPIQLTTSRIGNLTRLIVTLNCYMCDHTYMNGTLRLIMLARSERNIKSLHAFTINSFITLLGMVLLRFIL